MNKIIYSLRVMKELVELGNFPVATIPNPQKANLNCWVFKNDLKFQKDLESVLGKGARHE